MYIADIQRANLIRSSDWSDENLAQKYLEHWSGISVLMREVALVQPEGSDKEKSVESCLEEFRNHKQNHVILKSCALQSFVLGPLDCTVETR